MQPVDAFERDGEADPVGVDMLRLRGGFVAGMLVLEPVRRSVQRRRHQPAAEKGSEREEGTKPTDQKHSHVAESRRRTRKIR